ncbi:MAG TPA: hypothetical protein VL242_11095 [Sorangium sp.]|uniref:hypothetical protein n=1 Tax=Sorangium sp. So ce1153 TaxID=3133333 RepID=UPI002C815F9F|nr:hypothetical protein [Sorangium sp.]
MSAEHGEPSFGRGITAGAGALDDDDPLAPIALDSVGYGVGGLDAIIVFHLSDARVHAVFVREGAALSPGDVAAGLRDAYLGSQLAAQRLVPEREASARSNRGRGARSSSKPPGSHGRAEELPDPVVTLELSGRTVLLRRVRACVVASLFDGTMPLGMARLVAQRLAAALAPELPLEEPPEEMLSDPPGLFEEPLSADTVDDLVRGVARSAPPRGASIVPSRRAGGTPPPSEAPSPEAARIEQLLALLESRAPEPHVARLRLALRAGLTPLALEHPGELGAEAMVLIETAVADILGLERAALRRLL